MAALDSDDEKLEISFKDKSLESGKTKTMMGPSLGSKKKKAPLQKKAGKNYKSSTTSATTRSSSSTTKLGRGKAGLEEKVELLERDLESEKTKRAYAESKAKKLSNENRSSKRKELDEIKSLRRLAAERMKEIEELKERAEVKLNAVDRDPGLESELEMERMKNSKVSKAIEVIIGDTRIVIS